MDRYWDFLIFGFSDFQKIERKPSENLQSENQKIKKNERISMV